MSSPGYQIQLTSSVADCSNQGHVYVWNLRINPPANDGYDHRSLDDINSAGVDAKFPALDNIKPLSETILHEVRAGQVREEEEGEKKKIKRTSNHAERAAHAHL